MDSAELRNPSLRGDDTFRRWFIRFLRLAASPGVLADLLRMNAGLDIRPVLPRIRQPALILHRVGDPWVAVEHARYLAAHIPGARLVELAGIDHWPWIGDADALLDEVERFLTGAPPRAGRRPSLGPEALTRRERDVVRLAAEGHTAPQIGHLLGIGERTVETHLASAYAKLGVASKLELVRRAADLDV
ncbi:MAG TPA: LuxR C-terminal-related transcriptional regulator [Thermomicrobiales bacterium]|nr:LuxR C-terminal-related transcriptional regulator [Thermomicrobiales bacterium]